MRDFIVKPKNKKEEKALKTFLEDNNIEYSNIESLNLLQEDEVIYETKKKPKENPAKEQLLIDIKEAVKNVNLVKQGKLKAKSAKELLDEL